MLSCVAEDRKRNCCGDKQHGECIAHPWRHRLRDRERGREGRDDCAIAEAENGARLPGTLLGQVFFLSFFGQKVCRKTLYQGVATLTRLSIIYTQTLNVSERSRSCSLTSPSSWPCPTAACTFIVPLLLWHVPQRERKRGREKKNISSTKINCLG